MTAQEGRRKSMNIHSNLIEQGAYGLSNSGHLEGSYKCWATDQHGRALLISGWMISYERSGGSRLAEKGLPVAAMANYQSCSLKQYLCISQLDEPNDSNKPLDCLSLE